MASVVVVGENQSRRLEFWELVEATICISNQSSSRQGKMKRKMKRKMR